MGDGELDPRRCVFPVVLLKGEEVGPGKFVKKDAGFLGSGFFVAGTKSVAFVTARHVVDRKLADGERIGIANLADGSSHTWDGFELHDKADLAVARFPREKAPPFVSPLPAHFPRLHRGNGVSSFGFPFSGARETRGGKVGITIEEIFYRGYVSTIYDREQLSPVVRYPFGTSYGLSFESPNGLSGAPLLVLVDGTFHAAGVVYENRTVEFQVDNYHETRGEPEKEVLVVVNRVHNIGLAGALHEVADIVAFLGISD